LFYHNNICKKIPFKRVLQRGDTTNA